jgi:short-subunit dehydrogenase
MKKVVLITGASSGMGKETAKRLLQQGHTVYAVARRLDQMQDLRGLGGFPLQADVTNEANLQVVVDTILQKEGHVDVLWNNAGYGLFGSVEDVPMTEAHRHFEVNVFAMARLTQLVVPHMRQRRSGLIINTSSMGGKLYSPLGAWYHASKHAVEGFSDCLRLELKPFHINVVVLEPGVIVTEFSDVMLEHLTRFSSQGAYAGVASKLAATTKKIMSGNSASKPAVIADTIASIVASTSPKTRYRVGAWAKPMVWMRLYLGDRLFDKIVSIKP